MSKIAGREMTVMQCRNCRSVCDENANFCSRCGLRLKGVSTAVKAAEASPASVVGVPATPHPALISPHRSWWRRPATLVAVVIIGLLLLNGSFLALLSAHSVSVGHAQRKAVPTSHPSGVAWFYDLHGRSDGFALHLSDLPSLPSRHVYAGWLLNAYRPDQLLATGPLTRNSDGSSNFLSEQSATFNVAQQDLRPLFTQVVVTREQSGKTLQHPQGPTILSGSISQNAVNAITPLFVSAAYAPSQTALLTGLRTQVDELVRWVANLHDSQRTNDLVGMRADLLRMIYIIEGNHGADVQSLHVLSLSNIKNEGDGFGLLSEVAPCQLQQSCGYLDSLRLTLQSLANRHYITPSVLQALLTMLMTMQQLTQQIQQQALTLVQHLALNTSTDKAINLLMMLSSALQQGRDLDGDGHIDFVPGEASAAQFFAYVQYVGSIPLYSPSSTA